MNDKELYDKTRKILFSALKRHKLVGVFLYYYSIPILSERGVQILNMLKYKGDIKISVNDKKILIPRNENIEYGKLYECLISMLRTNIRQPPFGFYDRVKEIFLSEYIQMHPLIKKNNYKKNIIVGCCIILAFWMMCILTILYFLQSKILLILLVICMIALIIPYRHTLRTYKTWRRR